MLQLALLHSLKPRVNSLRPITVSGLEVELSSSDRPQIKLVDLICDTASQSTGRPTTAVDLI